MPGKVQAVDIAIGEGKAPSFLEDLKLVLDIPQDLIPSIHQKLNEDTEKTLYRDDIEELIERTIRRQLLADALIRIVMTLAQSIRQSGPALDDLKESVKEELLSYVETLGIDKFERIWTQIESLAIAPVVRIAEKISYLAFEHSCLMLDAEIYTDFRPVFDEDKKVIEAGVILQTLQLEVLTSGSEPEILDIALTKQDLRRLRDLVDEAESKSTSLKKFAAPSKLKIYVP